MLNEVCAELRNYFITEVHEGTFNINGGSIAPLDFLQNGQYFLIVGSVFNDGIHKYPSFDMTDEKFTGSVCAMALPPALIALADEIKAWNEKYSDIVQNPFTNESFGGYTYTKSTGNASSADGTDWQGVFKKRLNKWRKI